MREVPNQADAVVIGGGITGASALYHLAAAGCERPMLLERDTLGSGSTGAAAGGIRAQFSDELNVKIATECIAAFSRFQDEIGADIGFRQTGYLFLLRADEVPDFEAAVQVQRSLGMPTRMLSLDEIADLVPQLDLDGIVAATYNPLDGSADPGAAVQGYVDAARRKGAVIRQGVTVQRVVVRGDRVVGVETSHGTIATPTVVCAAGVWSAEIGAGVGIEIPVTPERRYVFQTTEPDDLPEDLPLTIDFTTGFYVHRERSRLLLGGPWGSAEDLAPIALARFPTLAEVPIRFGWSGYYEMSPDHNAIVGQASSPEGFLYATGFSGHGFQQSPVVGAYLADVALGREPAFDLSPFSLERFAVDSHFRAERNVV